MALSVFCYDALPPRYPNFGFLQRSKRRYSNPTKIKSVVLDPPECGLPSTSGAGRCIFRTQKMCISGLAIFKSPPCMYICVPKKNPTTKCNDPYIELALGSKKQMEGWIMDSSCQNIGLWDLSFPCSEVWKDLLSCILTQVEFTFTFIVVIVKLIHVYNRLGK